MRLKVQLIRSEDNSPVEAHITELAQKHIDDYENLWRESLRTFQTEDKFWDWVFKLEFITRQENHSGYASAKSRSKLRLLIRSKGTL